MPEATASVSRPAPGTPIAFRWRKWDGGVHWVHECVYLGRDEYGDWVGQQAGWRSVRPGRDVVAEVPNVTLVPPSADFACTVNEAGHRVRIYIDLGWDVRWSGPLEITGIDMDLDVVKALDGGGLWIDDRDEWDEHRVHYGYPDDVQRHLEALAEELERRVAVSAPPFDDATADAWLARLADLAR